MDDRAPATTRFILFCKYPAPGAVKTRLIPALGADGAARLQRQLIDRTLSAVKRAAKKRAAEIEVRFDGAPKAAFVPLVGETPRLVHQGEGDLGTRMARAFDDAFRDGLERVILFGADIPALTARILETGDALLASTDVVLGPAADGGYYLIGMRRAVPAIFDRIPWSTRRVFETTVQRLNRAHLSFALTDTLRDLDRPEDLVALKR